MDFKPVFVKCQVIHTEMCSEVQKCFVFQENDFFFSLSIICKSKFAFFIYEIFFINM